MKLLTLTRRYMAADVEGAAGGAVDRGDVVVDTTPVGAETSDKADVSTLEAPAKVGTEEDASKDQKSDDDNSERARDDSGRFTKKDGKGVIPLDRHEKVLERERTAREAAERRAQELEKQIKQVDKTEIAKELDKQIEDLEDKLESARLDGDKEKAKEYARELRLLERKVVTMETDRVGAETVDQARESIRMDMVIEKLEIDYPALNAAAEEYDQDLVDLVLAAQGDLIRRERMAPSHALEAAVKKVMSKVTAPKQSDDAAGLNAARAEDDRAKAQIAKNVDTAKRQPANTKEIGLDSDAAGQKGTTVDVSLMTPDEFDALPEATKAKLRGDFA